MCFDTFFFLFVFPKCKVNCSTWALHKIATLVLLFIQFTSGLLIPLFCFTYKLYYLNAEIFSLFSKKGSAFLLYHQVLAWKQLIRKPVAHTVGKRTSWVLYEVGLTIC